MHAVDRIERLQGLHPAMVDLMAAFGAFVRRARHCAGMTQQQLADRSGVSQSVISRLERGLAANIRLTRLLAIQAALGGCLPLGVCPHDHQCIWQPRTAQERAHLRAPGSSAPPYRHSVAWPEAPAEDD
jgi:DNA-binding Xre family transcriptional regulator